VNAVNAEINRKLPRLRLHLR